MDREHRILIAIGIVIFIFLPILLYVSDTLINGEAGEEQSFREDIFVADILEDIEGSNINKGLTLSFNGSKLYDNPFDGIYVLNNSEETIVFNHFSFSEEKLFWDEINNEWIGLNQDKSHFPGMYFLHPDETVTSDGLGFTIKDSTGAEILSNFIFIDLERSDIENYEYVMVMVSGIGEETQQHYYAYIELRISD